MAANNAQLVQNMQNAATSLPAAADEGLRDIKGYIAIIIPGWLLISLALIILSVLAYVIYVKFFRKEPVIELTVYERTIKNLTELDINLDSKVFYLHYSEYVKDYLENRLEIHCLEKTAEELAPVLIDDKRMRTNHAMFLGKILHRADLAKFAKHQVSLETKAKDIELGLDIVKTTEKALVAEESEEEEKSGPEFGPRDVLTSPMAPQNDKEVRV
jgi:hypothetical protein